MPRARSRRFSSASPASDWRSGEQLLHLRGVAFGDLLGQPELHGERHELLLRAVMEVPLQPAALLVLRGDEPLPRRPELLDRVQQLAR